MPSFADKTTRRFKVGDRVRKIGRTPTDVDEGTVGTVVRLGAVLWPHQVQFDGEDFEDLMKEDELVPASDPWPIPTPQAEIEREKAIDVAADAIFTEDYHEIAIAVVDALIAAGIIKLTPAPR